jgi:hypothetical protein
MNSHSADRFSDRARNAQTGALRLRSGFPIATPESRGTRKLALQLVHFVTDSLAAVTITTRFRVFKQVCQLSQAALVGRLRYLVQHRTRIAMPTFRESLSCDVGTAN